MTGRNTKPRANPRAKSVGQRPPPPLVYSMASLTQLLDLSRATLYAMIARGQFPAPRQMTARRACWDAKEVHAWLKARPHRTPTKGK